MNATLDPARIQGAICNTSPSRSVANKTRECTQLHHNSTPPLLRSLPLHHDNTLLRQELQHRVSAANPSRCTLTADAESLSLTGVGPATCQPLPEFVSISGGSRDHRPYRMAGSDRILMPSHSRFVSVFNP